MSRPEGWKPLGQQALWSLGFRPFFLAGAGFACLALGLWGLWLQGLWSAPALSSGMLAWHRHEMPFGFAVAIIAGFLLTAVPNWTGRAALHGGPLLLLWLVWLMARLAWWLPLPMGWTLALQGLFLPLLALLLGRELWVAGKRDNYPILLILVLLALFQGMVLWGIASADEALQRRGVLAALWLVAALMSMIGGRVIPFFIQRGLSRPPTPPSSPWPTRALLVLSLLAALSMAGGLGQQPRVALAPLFLLLALLQLWRLWRWHDAGLWRVPLLWSLYLAYAWLAVAALAMALWHLGGLGQQSLATHALAVGGLGGLVLAMLARVSLGHTGRPLVPPRPMVVGFALIGLAGLCRVWLVPFWSPGLGVSALLWCVAFAAFLCCYTGPLLQARR